MKHKGRCQPNILSPRSQKDEIGCTYLADYAGSKDGLIRVRHECLDNLGD